MSQSPEAVELAGAPAATGAAAAASGVLVPLVLAQFLCSFAATTMNVAISSIATDLNTNVAGVQTAITAFTLTMAALMIPGSKLTDIWGRKFCFRLGLLVYGAGALVAAFSQALPGLIAGYSLGEGIGTALLIPPVYILATVYFDTVQSRAKAFGAISAAAGVGSAAGPLIGGLITSAASWRFAFGVQTLLALVILYLGGRLIDHAPEHKPKFDLLGAVISAAGLVFIVVGTLQAGTYGWFRSSQDFAIGSTVLLPAGSISPVWLFELIGALLLVWFFRHIQSVEKGGGTPLVSIRMFQNRVSNLGLATQITQWALLLGLSFVVSVFLQTVRGYGAIETGLILTPATIGILASSFGAARFARRRSQAVLIRAGFVITIAGILLLLWLVPGTTSLWYAVPGLFLVGFGVGVMLTSSVNVVQSAFPEKDQGEISGVSRSVSNLGSSLGVAIAGTVIVSTLVTGNEGYALALIVLMVFGAIGLIAALMLPATPPPPPPLPHTQPQQ
jgi:MFS family permease